VFTFGKIAAFGPKVVYPGTAKSTEHHFTFGENKAGTEVNDYHRGWNRRVVGRVLWRDERHYTKILELHYNPGGLYTSWKCEGYTIDGCIHCLVGSSPGNDFYRI